GTDGARPADETGEPPSPGRSAAFTTPTVRDDRPPMHGTGAVLNTKMLDYPSCASQRPRKGSVPHPGCCATGTCSACCRPSARQHPPASTRPPGAPAPSSCPPPGGPAPPGGPPP